MMFKVLKSSFDGISGGESSHNSIDTVLQEVSYHKGWDTKAKLHKAIRAWSKNAHPGSVFCTQVTAIVAVAIEPGAHSEDECTECGHEGMDYEEFSPVEDGSIEQRVTCPECGRRWKDVFVICERRELTPVGV